MAASRPRALLYSRGLFGTLVSRLVREPINWQLIGCEILVTVTTVRKDFSQHPKRLEAIPCLDPLPFCRPLAKLKVVLGSTLSDGSPLSGHRRGRAGGLRGIAELRACATRHPDRLDELC